MGADGLPRGAHLRVRLGDIDDITLEIAGTVIERLDQPVEDADAIAAEDEDEPLGAPLALAIDVNDAQADNGAQTPGDNG